MKNALLVSVCLFGVGLGCVAATVAQPFVAPPARAGTNPQPWEYYCLRAGQQGFVEASNELGRQGWEMVSGAGTLSSGAGLASPTFVWCFKRPL